MSTLNVGTISATDITVANDFNLDAGYGSNEKIFGVRVWCKIDTTHTITGSGGISSVTDNGTGDQTYNFSITLPDANYSVVCGTSLGSGTAHVQLVTFGTTSFRAVTRYYTFAAFDSKVTMMLVR